jgi:hypothetical protein
MARSCSSVGRCRESFVGIVSVVTQRPFPVDAVAFEHCEALSFEWDALKALLETDVQAVFVVARIVGSTPPT